MFCLITVNFMQTLKMMFKINMSQIELAITNNKLLRVK